MNRPLAILLLALLLMPLLIIQVPTASASKADYVWAIRDTEYRDVDKTWIRGGKEDDLSASLEPEGGRGSETYKNVERIYADANYVYGVHVDIRSKRGMSACGKAKVTASHKGGWIELYVNGELVGQRHTYKGDSRGTDGWTEEACVSNGRTERLWGFTWGGVSPYKYRGGSGDYKVKVKAKMKGISATATVKCTSGYCGFKLVVYGKSKADVEYGEGGGGGGGGGKYHYSDLQVKAFWVEGGRIVKSLKVEISCSGRFTGTKKTPFTISKKSRYDSSFHQELEAPARVGDLKFANWKVMVCGRKCSPWSTTASTEVSIDVPDNGDAYAYAYYKAYATIAVRVVWKGADGSTAPLSGVPVRLTHVDSGYSFTRYTDSSGEIEVEVDHMGDWKLEVVQDNFYRESGWHWYKWWKWSDESPGAKYTYVHVDPGDKKEVEATYLKYDRVEGYAEPQGAGRVYLGGQDITSSYRYVWHGQKAQLSAQASGGYEFDYWERAVRDYPFERWTSDPSPTFEVDEGYRVRAVFRKLHTSILHVRSDPISIEVSYSGDFAGRKATPFDLRKEGVDSSFTARLSAPERVEEGEKAYKFAKWVIVETGGSREEASLEADIAVPDNSEVTAIAVYEEVKARERIDLGPIFYLPGEGVNCTLPYAGKYEISVQPLYEGVEPVVAHLLNANTREDAYVPVSEVNVSMPVDWEEHEKKCLRRPEHGRGYVLVLSDEALPYIPVVESLIDAYGNPRPEFEGWLLLGLVAWDPWKFLNGEPYADGFDPATGTTRAVYNLTVTWASGEPHGNATPPIAWTQLVVVSTLRVELLAYYNATGVHVVWNVSYAYSPPEELGIGPEAPHQNLYLTLEDEELGVVLKAFLGEGEYGGFGEGCATASIYAPYEYFLDLWWVQRRDLVARIRWAQAEAPGKRVYRSEELVVPVVPLALTIVGIRESPLWLKLKWDPKFGGSLPAYCEYSSHGRADLLYEHTGTLYRDAAARVVEGGEVYYIIEADARGLPAGLRHEFPDRLIRVYFAPEETRNLVFFYLPTRI